MAKGTRQPLKEEAPPNDVTRAPEGPSALFAPSNDRDSQPSANRSLSLQLTDFQSLVRRSTAAIGCIAFAKPVSSFAESPSAFSAQLYAASSVCLEANAAFAQLLGYSKAQDLIGIPLAALLPRHHGYAELFADWYRRSCTMDGFEWRASDPEGRHILIHTAIYATLIGNDITRLWIIIRDVSALARAITAASNTEQHYREILNQPEVLFLRIYVDGTVAFASEETQQALTLEQRSSTPVEEILSLRAHPDDRAKVERIALHRHGLSRSPLTISIRLVTQPQGLCSFKICMMPHLTGDEVDGYDILAVKLSSLSPSEHDADATATLAAGLAHDANNHLAVVTSSIELARESLPSGHPALDLLDSAMRSVSHCATINAQALQLSSGIQPQHEAVDITELFTDVISQLTCVMPAGIILLSSVQSDHLWAWIDRTHLTQALFNLVINARDALGSTGVITLSATRKGRAPTDTVTTGGLPICISVSDNGPGIDDALRDKLFHPFVTTKSRTRRRGLGLSMVKTLIEHNGGEVSVTSAPGMGSTFTLSLPPASPASTAPTLRSQHIPSPPSRDRRALTVLIADDEPDVRRTLLSAFTSRGHQATAVPDARSLIEEISRAALPYNLVILDDGMPGSSAFELSQDISNRAPHLPIIVASGNPALKYTMSKPHHSRFLSKPFTLTELFKEVELLVEPSE